MTRKIILSNSELRRMAREKLKGNWAIAIILLVIYSSIGLALSFIPIIGTLVNLAVSGALTLGLASCFLNLIRGGQFKIENLFDGFSNFKSSLLLHLLVTILTLLWSLLLIIPGIIASYKYSMAFYILHDNPDIGASEAVDRSKELMHGNKGRLFLLHLSFVGWSILATLTLGIGFLWLMPYIQTTSTAFYQNLKEANNDNLVNSLHPIHSLDGASHTSPVPRK